MTTLRQDLLLAEDIKTHNRALERQTAYFAQLLQRQVFFVFCTLMFNLAHISSVQFSAVRFNAIQCN